MEQWQDIIDYEGFYQVSNLGRVRSLDRIIADTLGRRYTLKGKLLRSNPNSYGHLSIALSRNGIERTINIHKLVAIAFLGPRPPGQWILHGARGKSNNSVDNLSYGTPLRII